MTSAVTRQGSRAARPRKPVRVSSRKPAHAPPHQTKPK
jgi:hypothetical protein